MRRQSGPVQRVHVALVIESVAPAHADEWAVDIKAAVDNWFRHGDVVEVKAVNVSVEPAETAPQAKATPPMHP